MTAPTETGATRRQVLVAGGTVAGYALSVETVLAQAIKTDTDGLVAGDQQISVGGVQVPVYEARPATGKDHPILLVISEIWGVHEYIKDCTRRFAKAGYCAVAPELFVREGGVAQIPNVQDVLKIVLAQKREQTLGDLKAAVDWANATQREGRSDRRDRLVLGRLHDHAGRGHQCGREGGRGLVRAARSPLPGRQRSRHRVGPRQGDQDPVPGTVR
jgi:Dienelactone hydrolase family